MTERSEKIPYEYGVSVYVCFGRWAGFGISHEMGNGVFRIVLGWVAIGLLNFDIEVLLAMVEQQAKRMTEALLHCQRTCSTYQPTQKAQPDEPGEWVREIPEAA